MSRREETRQIGNVVLIRQLQKLEAQAQLVSAEDRLAVSREARDACETELVRLEEDLTAYHKTLSIHPTHLALHGRTILDAAERFDEASEAVARSHVDADQKSEQVKRSIAQIAQAEFVETRVLKYYRKKVEEMRLAEQEEQISVKWTRA